MGVLFVADVPDRQFVFHLVGRRMTITIGESWGGYEPQTRLVVIGMSGGIDVTALIAGFDACHGDDVRQLHNVLPQEWVWSR